MQTNISKISGLAVSNGRARGKALVINNLKVIPVAHNSGYIVVAPYTTPNLNLILMNAGGIVCETGGLTTHAAIIARELGIPCLVGVKDALKKISNNQEIEINSKNHEVIIYE